MSQDSWSIRVLGRFAVLRRDEEIPVGAFGGRLVRRLLRVLAVRRGEFLSKDALAEALWPERLPSEPAANLEVLVSRLRRALGDPTLILTRPGGYALTDDDRCRVDAEAVLAAVERGRAGLSAGRPDEALVAFEDAVGRWAGDPVPEDAYEEWSSEFRTTMARAFQEALESGATAALATGDPARAVAFAERAVLREPLREPATLLLVRALAASGDRAGALAAFAAFRERYADELGLDPSSEAEEVQARVLRGEPRSAPSPPSPAAPIEGSEETAFVGREAELARLLGPERVVVIDGVSGSGKSRLLAEAARRAPIPVLRVRAFLPERDQPWSLARSVLREAIGLDALAASAPSDLATAALLEVVPELADLRELPRTHVDPRSRRALVLEAAVQVVRAVAQGPVVLMVDDLQWADRTSLQLLSLLVTRVDHLRTVVAYRPDEFERGSPVAEFLLELDRGHAAHRLSLGPLEAPELDALVGDPLVARLLVEETDRTPIAVAGALRLLQDEGLGALDARGRWRVRPGIEEADVRGLVRAGQGRAIAERVRRLPEGARSLLGALALLGREGSTRTLGHAVGFTARETLAALETLVRTGLARVGERGWAIAHDSIAEALVRELGPAERAALHGAIAAALSETSAEPSELADHLAAAGEPEAAVAAYANAAERSLRRFANEEATALARSGLGLEPDDATRVRLLGAAAEARSRMGDLSGAKEDLRAAIASIDPGPDRSDLLTRLAMLESGSEDYERAGQLVDLALAEAAEDGRRRARAHAVGAIVDLNLGRLERSEERSNIALGLFEALGDARGAAGILDGRAMATFLAGRIREAESAFDRVARLFRDAGELMSVGTPRSTRGHALVFMARPDDGLRDIEESLELSRALGHAEGESYALWHRAEALAALGRGQEAIASATEALAIAERIGHREWTVASLRGLGIAHEAAGDLEAAAAAHGRGLEGADGIPLFLGWAAARLATCLVGLGRTVEAAPLVERALDAGSPLAAYEARLADVEVRAARADPDLPTVARAAAAAAEAGGHEASLGRLVELAGGAP